MLVIVYRDENTNEKKFHLIESPNMTFYVANEGVDIPHHLDFIEKDKVEPVSVKYSDIGLELAKIAGEEYVRDYFNTLKKSSYWAKKKFHKLPFIFNSDMEINDYYKMKFLTTFKSEKKRISKSYFDIEVNISKIIGFPDEHVAPSEIDLITYIHVDTKKSYTYILMTKDNPTIQHYMDNRIVYQQKMEEIIDADNEGFEFIFEFFDSELDLIKAFFQQVNQDKPDVCMAWNARFDLLTIINRLKNEFNVDIADLAHHPDFPKEVKHAFYYEDKKGRDLEKRSDYFQCSSYTLFMDQLVLYASIRSAQTQRSYSLSSIAKDELKDDKLDYSEFSSLKTLSYDDFWTYLVYSVKDVYLLHKLEQKLDDLDMLFTIGENTFTRTQKALRSTISESNKATKFYSDQGYIRGNNINISEFKDDDGAVDKEKDEKYVGAWVALPSLNANRGKNLYGRPSKFVYDHVVDVDLASLYPSIIIAFNLASSTQYGKIEFDVDIEEDKDDTINMEFIDKLTTNNHIQFSSDYFNAPTLTDLCRDIINNDYIVPNKIEKRTTSSNRVLLHKLEENV